MSPCYRNRVSWVSPLIVLAAACGSSEETRPVDAKFRATVEGGPRSGSVVSVDVYWRGDGSVDVTFDDVEDAIPGPDALTGVVLGDGNAVLNEGMVEVEGDETKHLVRLEGHIRPEALDLELTDRPDGGGSVTVRLEGPARPFDDDAELDGEYLLQADRYPALCPGDTDPPLGGSNLRLDVLSLEGAGLRLTLDGRLVFTLPDEASVSWAGTITDRWYGGTFTAAASGTLDPAAIELSLEVPAPDFGAGCVDRIVLTGGKRLPDPTVIDGDYRASYVWRDECRDEEGRFSAPISLVQQDEGMVDFHEWDGTWMRFSMAAGQPFSGEFYDIFNTWAMIAYDGVVEPPGLSYVATYEYPYDPPCTVTLEVEAHKRYFFPAEGE